MVFSVRNPIKDSGMQTLYPLATSNYAGSGVAPGLNGAYEIILSVVPTKCDYLMPLNFPFEADYDGAPAMGETIVALYKIYFEDGTTNEDLQVSFTDTTYNTSYPDRINATSLTMDAGGVAPVQGVGVTVGLWSVNSNAGFNKKRIVRIDLLASSDQVATSVKLAAGFWGFEY